jgi:hypothetical protein
MNSLRVRLAAGLGIGNVSHTCPGTFYAPFRSSRLRSKIVYCTYL